MSVTEWLLLVAIFGFIAILEVLRSLRTISNQLNLIRDQLDSVVGRGDYSLANILWEIKSDVRAIAKAPGADDDKLGDAQ